jgi:hypothetical protein
VRLSQAAALLSSSDSREAWASRSLDLTPDLLGPLLEQRRDLLLVALGQLAEVLSGVWAGGLHEAPEDEAIDPALDA